MIHLWQIIESLWFVWVIAFAIAVFPILLNILIRKIKEIKLKRWLEKHKTLEDWKKLDGREFEKVVALIYQNLGYKTRVVGGAGDKGIDVIAKKDGRRNFIQCKRMSRVIPDDVRAFHGSIVNRLKEGEKGFLVTTGDFTEQGREFAKDKPIELINGLKLEKLKYENPKFSKI